MADSRPGEPGETGEDTDELLRSDVEDEVVVSGPTPAQLARDHCDILLDAIDAQLSRLQAQSHAVRARGDDGNAKAVDHSSAALSQSQPASHDTGLGSTLPTNDTSTPTLRMGPSETQELSSDERSRPRDPHSEEEEDDGKGAVVGEAEEESEQELCRWRLELLLGRAEGGFESSPSRQADSVCTEDFASRFREEMLEPLGGVTAEEAGPGSRGSWDSHTPGPWGRAHRGEEAVGVQESGAAMGWGIPALGKMVVGVKGTDGCNSGCRRGPRHAWDSPQSLGQGPTVAQHSHLTPPGGDTGQSGETIPNHRGPSQAQSPLGCMKLSSGRSVSMTALTESTPLCFHMLAGTAPARDGTNQTSTPCAEGSGGVPMASLKHKPDIVTEKVNGSGTRMMLRRLSCPGLTPNSKLKLRVPSRGWTPRPRSPLRDTDKPHCPPPPAERPRVEQRHELNVVQSHYGSPCSGSAPHHCTRGGPAEAGCGSAPAPASCGTDALTVSRSSMNTVEAEGVPGPPAHPPVRHLAGVPVKSFDSVTIDSDLDSVRTDRVRKHFQNALRCSAAVRCARGLHLEDLCTDLSDPDLVLEPRSKFSLQALRRNVPGGSRHIRKPRHPRREAPSAAARHDCSDDEETDEVEEEQEQGGLSGLSSLGLLQSHCAPWRRRSGRSKRPHLRTLTSGWLEAMDSDWLLLEEALHVLRQNCLREEERLKQKRDQLHDTELSLTTLLQQQKHAVQELECARTRVEQAEREGRGLEASLRDSRVQAESTRSQLRILQTQRDAHLQEMSDLEAELAALRRHKAVLQDRTGAEFEKRLHGGSVSVLEREELDRQLDGAKAELFAEQRRARLKLEALQERLEETQQELDQRMEELQVLREDYSGLDEQLTNAKRQGEELEQRRREEVQAQEAQVQELQGQLKEQGSRLGAQERLLAKQEVQQQEAQEQLRALLEQRRSLEQELASQREEHCAKLKETQEQAGRDKELELEQLRSELGLAGKQEIQRVFSHAEEEKQEALKEQALSHTQHAETLQACIQLKEEELKKLKDALEQQEASARKRVEELRVEAQVLRLEVEEQVRQAVDEERRKCEAEKGEELRAQRELLEDQGRRAVERVSEDVERKKRNSLALQKKIVELQTRLQEQESEGRLQQREHTAALAAMRRSLREEQQAESRRLRRQLEQETQREVSRLQQAVQQAQGEAQALQAELAERGRSQEEGVLRAERQQLGWATELGTECQQLQELLEHCGATGGAAVHLPHNPTVAQVVQTLRSMREQLYSLVSRLQQDLDTQRHANQQLSRDKEREIRTQREQLTVEKEQALDSLRERLIQDHIEELSTLQRTQLRESGGEAGGVAVSLRRQLQDKDSELREVQRSMGRWKEQTAARLARKFEEELTAELERCKAQLLKERRVPRARMDQQRKLQRLESEMRQLTTEYGDPGVLRSTSTPSLLFLDPPAAPGPPDLATFKLLRHLQSRVRQLRAENSVQSCSPVHLGTQLGPHLGTHLGPHLSTHLGTHLSAAGELAGSYLETIGPSSDRCPVRSHAHIRTIPN